MPRIAYVNGRYVPHGRATVHIEDRGYQFADGVYEVIAIVDGELIDEAPHLERLARSLDALRISCAMGSNVMSFIMRELILRNRIRNGIIYIQITRGAAPRDHKFPKDAKPSIVMTTKPVRHSMATDRSTRGVHVVTIPDIRWKRCDIKSISLLPNVLGKQTAVERGAYEAWQVDADGFVTEGTSTNAWIVTPARELVTRQSDSTILNGITRRTLIALAEASGATLVERPFSVSEALGAPEAFLTSTTSFLTPVVRIDGTDIGDGKPGPLSRELLENYASYVGGYGATADSARGNGSKLTHRAAE